MDVEKYTDRAKGFLQSAQGLALREGHQRFLPEHLLKVLLDDPEGMAANLIQSAGGNAKGLSLATEPLATVTAPCDGWVVYAGPFRSYGQLLIINAGDGYHVVLSGMDRINVGLGQFVLTGEPVGAMGTGETRVASTALGAVAQPTLYVEFRKDGVSIDPTPWWADKGEKARG